MTHSSDTSLGRGTGILVGLGVVAAGLASVELIQWARPLAASRSVGMLTVQFAAVVAALVPLVLAGGWWFERRCRRADRRAHTRAASELSVLQDELIANVSHELRTPLTGIVGYAHLLDESTLGAAETEAVSVIMAQAAELSRLVDDRMTAARLDAGMLSFDLRETSIVAETQEAASFLRLHGETVEVDCREASVWVDPERLRQVLRNLVVNAHHHGRPQIRIAGNLRGDRYILQVVDHGPGVPAEIEERLFERFVHQGDTPRVTGSVGLGLAVVQELCQAMGASVSYRHIRGETHFIVSLPIYRPERVKSVDVPRAALSRPQQFEQGADREEVSA